MGLAGLVGIILFEHSALIALGINQLGVLAAGDALVLTSVLTGALGRIIVGWLAAKGKVFPAWAGWTFLIQGLLNLAGHVYLYNLGTFGSTLGTIVFLLDSIAVFGYGLGIVRESN